MKMSIRKLAVYLPNRRAIGLLMMEIRAWKMIKLRTNRLKTSKQWAKPIIKQQLGISGRLMSSDWYITTVNERNKEKNMEKHLSDTHSNDSQSSGFAETTKSNTMINFSVESILSNENRSKKIPTENMNSKSFENILSLPKSMNCEDPNRIYRPMAMRPMPSATFFQGKKMHSIFMWTFWKWKCMNIIK